MRTIALIFLILGIADCFAQKNTKTEKAFEAAGDLYQEGKVYEARDAYEAFMKNYYWSSLVPRAHYNIGYINFELRDYKQAARVFNEILESDYDEMEKNGLMEPYTLYKHRSARFLAEISLEVKEWDEAERYIDIFDKKYRYQHFCGNEWAAYDIMKATMEARLHEGRGKIDEAVKILVPHIFFNGFASNGDAVNLMINILQRNYSNDEILRELNAALNSIRSVKKESGKDFYVTYVMTLFGIDVDVTFYELAELNNVDDAKKVVMENEVFAKFLK